MIAMPAAVTTITIGAAAPGMRARLTESASRLREAQQICINLLVSVRSRRLNVMQWSAAGYSPGGVGDSF
jgi:hypothetical protein